MRADIRFAELGQLRAVRQSASRGAARGQRGGAGAVVSTRDPFFGSYFDDGLRLARTAYFSTPTDAPGRLDLRRRDYLHRGGVLVPTILG